MLDRYGDHPDQVIEFVGNEGPLVVLIHGGYWKPVHTREHMEPLARKLSDSGFKVANIEYRREPGNPQATFDDLDSVAKKLKGATAVVGFSVGGQLALVSGFDTHKLILLAPVTDLQRTKDEKLGEDAVINFFGDSDLNPYDPMKKNYTSHIFLIHGDQDNRVPIQHSRDFAKAKGAVLLEVAGADHFAMIDPEGLAFELINNALLSK